MTRPDVLGRPLEEAERLLLAAGIPYSTELTRPARNVFPVDEARLYTVRAVFGPGGMCRLTAAAKQRREV